MKTYYFCDTDNNGQRIGTYQTIKLSDKEIKKDRFGNETYKGKFLYDDLYQVNLACQN